MPIDPNELKARELAEAWLPTGGEFEMWNLGHMDDTPPDTEVIVSIVIKHVRRVEPRIAITAMPVPAYV